MPLDEAARVASLPEIKAELQTVLSSRGFRQSKGLSKLLRYLCSAALIDDPDQISEYSIAVDALGKSTDFKDSRDASVRVEVHRLRKRLAQYYEEEGAGHALRIVIPTGNYAPQFIMMAPEAPNPTGNISLQSADAASGLETPEVVEAVRVVEETTTVDAQALAPALPEEEPTLAQPGPRARTVWLREAPPPLRNRLTRLHAAGAALILSLVACAAYLVFFHHMETPLDRFWGPVVATPGDALICVGNREGGRFPSTLDHQTLSLQQFHNLGSQTMLVADAATLSGIVGALREQKKPYRVLSQSETTFRDLQNGPVVLVGLRNNDWTERLIGQLRFTVEQVGPSSYRIRDRNNPGRMEWQTDFAAPYLNIQRDYALVLRVLDPKTDRMVVAAAGISMFGTLAAGELLTSNAQMRKLEAHAPSNWKGKNLEAVVATEVIKGKCGHPEVVAAYFW